MSEGERVSERQRAHARERERERERERKRRGRDPNSVRGKKKRKTKGRVRITEKQTSRVTEQSLNQWLVDSTFVGAVTNAVCRVLLLGGARMSSETPCSPDRLTLRLEEDWKRTGRGTDLGVYHEHDASGPSRNGNLCVLEPAGST